MPFDKQTDCKVSDQLVAVHTALETDMWV